MRRRDLLKAALAGGALGAVASAESSELLPGGRVAPVIGPDHPLAPRKSLVYGLGITAQRILSRATEDGFIGDYWLMWAGVRNTDADYEVAAWNTDLYPFSERNTTRLLLLTRLGDAGADLVVPTALAWQHRVPVEILLLNPEPAADATAARCAGRQYPQIARLAKVTRLGVQEESVQELLDIGLGGYPV